MTIKESSPGIDDQQNEAEVIPVHQWTNGGDEVLIVRFAGKDGKSASVRLVNGRSVNTEPFQHPMNIGETVTAPDWDPRPICGGGIHGWPWAMSLGTGKNPEWDALWQVYGVKPEDIVPVENDGKIKFRTGVLRHIGTWHSATDFVLKGQMAWVFQASHGTGHATGDSSASSATGDSSASSATGYRSASSATGDRSASSATGYSSASSATGDSSASSATGDRSASSATGDRSASSATGYRSASSATGKCSLAGVTGRFGRARAGEFGVIALAWWNEKEQRFEMRCARTGEGQECKADTWYELDENGQFTEVQQ